MSRRREGIGYMVIRNEDPSLVRHDSEDAAIKEAERLAENTRGDYIVLRPVELIRPAPKTERYMLRPAPEGVPGSQTAGVITEAGDVIATGNGPTASFIEAVLAGQR